MKKTIKIIDLYNIIADGEIPKKIKYNTRIYEYDADQDDYSTFVISHYEYLLDDINVTSQLNDEVEILDGEEFEDIEELDIEDNAMNRSERYIRKSDNKFITLSVSDYVLANKINQLIKNQKKIIERLNKDK